MRSNMLSHPTGSANGQPNVVGTELSRGTDQSRELLQTLSPSKRQDLRFQARVTRLHLPLVSDFSRMPTPTETMEWWVFSFDPFQAKTLPVFESIYRYGREMVS